MNNINPIPSPGDYIWNNSSMSAGFPQGNGGPSNPYAVHQPSGYHVYESFHPLNTDAPPRSPTFGDNPPYASDDDIVMTEGTNTQDGNQPPTGSQIPPIVSRRSRHGNLDWEGHKDELKEMYLDENWSLKDTMRAMKEKYSFPESAKWYKEKFKYWGWQKNLPNQYAHWMTQKADKRKRDDGKETVFFYGGLQWDKSDAERSATRSKKARTGSDLIVVDTPAEIHYETPKDMVLSPRNVSLSRASKKGKRVARLPAVVETADAQSESEDGDEDEVGDILLSWQGQSRSELIAVFDSARSHARQGDHKMAEDMFLTALEGYKNVLGTTHEDSVKVAFAAASFYIEQDRSVDADKIIEDVCRSHLMNFGIEDRRTQQLILQIVELLNGWDRRIDALGFLARSKQVAEGTMDSYSSLIGRKGKTHRRGKSSQRQDTPPGAKLMDIARDIIAENSLSRVEYGIGIARAHVAAKDEAVEAFLEAIIQHCESDPNALETQSLRARNELLRLYNKLGQSSKQTAVFLSAIKAVEASASVLGLQNWNKERFDSFEVMEALLELTASVLKGGFEDEAEKLFRNIIAKAEHSFGWDEERTIWAKITIGIVYQTHKSWIHAVQWFNHALAASIAANGDEDGISKALQAAMEKRHFSYLSEEGRPFKSIFGVTGLTIRPSRLHLD